MPLRQLDIGFSTADAEDVQLSHDGDHLTVTCRDWQGRDIEHTFRHVLAFRWGQDLGPDFSGRDDCAYDVLDSDWLRRESRLAAVDPSRYRHYKLCFNAAGVLDVLALKGEA